jgi:hypothetical protein
VQVPPPVEVMRTVLAVTAPLVAAWPNALTQSPTANELDVVDWVAFTGVELDVVMVSVSVFGRVGFFVFELDFVVGRANPLPGFTVMPETVSVEPLTPVTVPDAMSRLANCLRKFLPPEPPPGNPAPLRNWKPPDAPPLAAAPVPPVPVPILNPPPAPPQDPLDVAGITLIERAAMVVLDVFDAVPVTVTQLPVVSELTASVTVFENCVVGVQLTVVWPVLAFCTSMLEVLSAATLPVAPIGFEVLAAPAVPAADTMAATATKVVPPAPRSRAQCR